MGTGAVSIAGTENRFETVGRIIGEKEFGNDRVSILLLTDCGIKTKLSISCMKSILPEHMDREKIKITGHIKERRQVNRAGREILVNSLIADKIEPARTLCEEYFGDAKGIFSDNFSRAYVRGIAKHYQIDGEFMRLSIEVDRDNPDRTPQEIKMSMRIKNTPPFGAINPGDVVEAVCSVSGIEQTKDGKTVKYTDLTISDIAIVKTDMDN